MELYIYDLIFLFLFIIEWIDINSLLYKVIHIEKSKDFVDIPIQKPLRNFFFIYFLLHKIKSKKSDVDKLYIFSLHFSSKKLKLKRRIFAKLHQKTLIFTECI